MSEYPDASSLPLLGRVAVHAGREYRARGKNGSPDVFLYMDRQSWGDFTSVRELARGGPGDRDLWVFVGRETISRLFTRLASATWLGIEVRITAPIDTETVLVWFGGDPEAARERGMEGSQYEDWRAVVPFAELSSIRIAEE